MPAAPLYVIGHKNPDADAICSAIAYAALKRARGVAHAVAARCGNSNARIDAILERFKQPLPVYLGDVTPRVRDIMVSKVITAQPHNTCAEALELFDRHGLRTMPIVDADHRLLGSVSILQLGQYFIPRPSEGKKLRHVRTSVADIVRSLKADVRVLFEADREEDLFVRVGAMDIRSFGRFSEAEGIAAKESVIVVGDRWDIQQKSIQAGVRLLIVTGNLQVDAEVEEQARERGVSLVVSPYDSATTSWVVRSAGRIDRIVDKKVVTFSPDEKLAAVKRKVANQYAAAYEVIDDDGKLIGVFTKTDLLKPVPTSLVLVDHNELSQAVTGAAEVTITEIIDHHRLGNPPTHQPILFVNEPVGSTCTIVASMFQRDGLKPSPEIAGVLMSGIITDTLHLQSPTSTERDHDLLKWLAALAHEDPSKLAEMLFSSGSIILTSAPEGVIRSDFKAYEEGPVRFSVSQIEELGFQNFWEKADELLTALEAIREHDNLYFAALLVTDIYTQNSLLCLAGPDEVREAITMPTVQRPDVFDMPGIVSRKKQLIPFLTSMLKTVGASA